MVKILSKNETDGMWVNMSLGDRGVVQTIRPDFKAGIRIPNEVYRQIAHYIFNLISSE